ncbi:hypothetical protein ACFSJU_04020 [Paradesertivirga mongoliensis]|uniref:ATP/GTP-binding protein n=1 Tax=Paradesertivirga mongoliensis TaxID=2100740 RepID=A0ABW4ZII4_9SPHI|nr:hypothetical protein [Pedobacter mongoliensis]
MKKIILSSLGSLLMLICLSPRSQAQEITLTQIWQSDTSIRTPESVLFEPKENVLYVSCINGNPTADNKSSFISKMSPDGKVLTLKFTNGLNSPKGMGILDNKLYVTEITGVAEIDLASGKIIKRYPVEGAKFLNDIAVDTKNGIIYISDSGTNKLHALKNGRITLISEDALLKGINGLLMQKNQLLIGNGNGSLLSLNTATNTLSTIAKGMGGIDGIVGLANEKYIVSEWGGKVWYVNSGTPQLLIDSSKEKINTADMEYNSKTKTLYIPNFYHNTVTAYTVK